MLFAIKAHIGQHPNISLNELAHYFDVSPSAMQAMVGQWMAKATSSPPKPRAAVAAAVAAVLRPAPTSTIVAAPSFNPRASSARFVCLLAATAALCSSKSLKHLHY